MMAPAVECQWMAGCTRQAAGAAKHPALEWVLTCRPCATRFELELFPADLATESGDVWRLQPGDGIHPDTDTCELLPLAKVFEWPIKES